MRLGLSRRGGFTLIELLVVILIIAILVAVSAPSFLGQTQKAHDSVVKQYLTVAYRAAKAGTTDRDGNFTSAALVVADISGSEPELDPVVGSCPGDVTSNPKHIVVDSTGTTGDSLEMCSDPNNTVWVLRVIHNGPVTITAAGDQSGPTGPPVESSTVSGSDSQAVCAALPTSSSGQASAGTPFGASLCYLDGSSSPTINRYSEQSLPSPTAGYAYFGDGFTVSGHAAPNTTYTGAANLRFMFSAFQGAFPTGIGANQIRVLYNGQPLPACQYDLQGAVTNGPCGGLEGGNSDCASDGDGNPLACYTFEADMTSVPSGLFALAYSTCVSSAPAASPAAKSLLAFGINSSGETLPLLSLNSDGSGKGTFADGCPLSGLSSFTVSGDGSRVAYWNYTANAYDIWTVSSAGGTPVKVASSQFATATALSPDGAKIFYVDQHYSGGNNQTVSIPIVANSDGSNPTSLSLPSGTSDYVYAAAFVGSNRLALALVDTGDSNYGIWTMDLNGQNPVRLTTDSSTENDLSVSPDGSQIAYDTAVDVPGGQVSQLFSVPSDGSSAAVDLSQSGPLDLSSKQDYWPAWSPDGSKLGYLSYASGDSGFSVWMMDADGSNQTQLTNDGSTGSASSPSWSPDGSKLAFLSTRDATPDNSSQASIYTVVASQGESSVTRLTNDDDSYSLVAWR